MPHAMYKMPPIRLEDMPAEAMLRPKELIINRIVPFTANTLWRKVKQGTFPSPVKVSSAITAFRVGEVREWAANPSEYRAEVV